jgi:hypothetical protein
MYSDQDVYEVYPDYQKCCNCGGNDTCATAGADHFCGQCWDEYQREKAARKAKSPPVVEPKQKKGLSEMCGNLSANEPMVKTDAAPGGDV